MEYTNLVLNCTKNANILNILCMYIFWKKKTGHDNCNNRVWQDQGVRIMWRGHSKKSGWIFFFCPTNWEMQHIERPWTTVLEDELQRRCLFEPRTFNRQIFFCATYIGGFFLQCSFLFVVPLGQTKNVLRLNKVIWKFQFFIKCQKTFSLKVNCAWSGPWSDRLLSHFKKRAIIFIVARWVIKWGPKIVIRYVPIL